MDPLLHPSTAAQVNSVLRQPKSAYLFIGQSGTGRATTARWLAKKLHCGAQTGCSTCHLIDTGAYGDFITLEPQDSGSIGIAQTQELLSRLGKSRLGDKGVRMVVITAADSLTVEAQNSLLKTIEEPPQSTMVMLVVADTAALLETIKSRCQPVYFAPLPDAAIAKYVQTQYGLDEAGAFEIAELALGSVGTAVRLTQDQEHKGRLNSMVSLIRQIEAASLFEKLVLASKIQEEGFDVAAFVALQARRLRSLLRSHPDPEIINKISGLERFERYLKSNVNGRSAWSRLLLEL